MFNWQCRLGKREIRKAAEATNKFPTSEFLRLNYYKVKKSYKSLIKKHKNNYFDKLNKDIENGKIISWNQFKKLKNYKSDKIDFDCQDMNNFETFFRKLYSDNHNTISTDIKQSYNDEADIINSSSQSPYILNDPISLNEVKSIISSLKSGKASSIDMICNEILKSLNKCNLVLLTKLFNTCLEVGSYPWNVNVITPLHKKGCKDDPDNYRAIAVSSVIGKLFSTILLNRLIEFRNVNCPDPPNQLGFTKNAQTYDHILTMQTIASKYKKLKKNVHAVFVDFRKAFDSVCRQALFYKLAQNGITGKFYDVLRDMYSNSYAHIKLSGYLSNAFNTRKGTEQGHPLSPDLFKVFLSDLSPLLEYTNCPTLTNRLISHLLWADDLILLSLDEKTAQAQIDQLSKFCNQWGIEINQLKTKRVIFGRKNKINPSQKLHINGELLETVESYCYLGIIMHESGNFAIAINDLKNKAMRALFGLKRTVKRNKLSFRALTTLYDSLIKPIILYGAPIWTPTLSIIKNLSAAVLSRPNNLEGIISKINRIKSEKVHQFFLKWALGSHKKASNIGTFGESGRYPLIYQSIKLTLSYYQRLTELNQDKFVFAALQEQKSMKLPWYKNIESLMKIDEIFDQDHVSAFLSKKHPNPNSSENPMNKTTTLRNRSMSFIKNLAKLKPIKPLPSKQFRPFNVLKTLREHFRDCWEYEKSKSPKLAFYHAIKQNFQKEPYLDNIKNASNRYRTTRLRISAHDLEIEHGRYKGIPREERICKWCKLSLSGKYIEDECHVLYKCDLYGELRTKLINTLNKSPNIEDSSSTSSYLHINSPHALENSLMKLLSPNVTTHFDEHDPLLHHHLITNVSLDSSKLKQRSYIINAIGSFIANCFEKRWSFLADLSISKPDGTKNNESAS
ncbi:MAG: reverse transcriptase family protein [Saccharospirillaceae bacterium]|nr:reverse transcriptase family protein [Saccharospirillaceae bacterium]